MTSFLSQVDIQYHYQESRFKKMIIMRMMMLLKMMMLLIHLLTLTSLIWLSLDKPWKCEVLSQLVLVTPDILLQSTLPPLHHWSWSTELVSSAGVMVSGPLGTDVVLGSSAPADTALHHPGHELGAALLLWRGSHQHEPPVIHIWAWKIF